VTDDPLSLQKRRSPQSTGTMEDAVEM
jgi:hypothetical protein